LAYDKAFAELKRKSVVVDLEVDIRRKDGSTFPARINSTAVFDGDGRFLYSRDTVRDTTREGELQSQLLQEQKLESLGTLAGGIAHDFNNLLTSIMGYSQLALASFEPSSKTHENLSRVVSLGDQAAGLIRQLLTFSRKAHSEKKAITLVPIAKETAKVMERTLPETIDVVTNIDKNVWNVEADATQMQQVLMNLCVNARDGMPDGGQLTIQLANGDSDASRPDDRRVCLSVEDTGVGIPPEIQERIFEPFFTTKDVGRRNGAGSLHRPRDRADPWRHN